MSITEFNKNQTQQIDTILNEDLIPRILLPIVIKNKKRRLGS